MLDVKFADATSKEMIMEFWAKTTSFKLKEAKVMALEAKERAEVAKTKAWVVKVEVTSVGTQVVMEYKKSKDFEDEVSEAAYDAYQQGFVKCKKMVTEAFLGLDLASIVDVEPEQQEEGRKEEAKTKVIEEVTETRAVVEVEFETTKGAKAEVKTAKEARIGDAMESTREVANTRNKEASIQEIVAKAMAGIEAMINVVIEAIKAG